MDKQEFEELLKKYAITPLAPDTLQPAREIEFADVTFCLKLYDEITKTKDLENWNALVTGNSAEWWTSIQESAEEVKSVMDLTIVPQTPLVTSWAAYSEVPFRYWGNGGKEFFSKFREAVYNLLENRVRLMQLSQICWNASENAQISLQSIWNSPLTANVTTAGADMEEILGNVITNYMALTGRYPKQLVLNPAATNALVANDNVVSGEIVVGYDKLFDIDTYSIPDYSVTASTMKIIVGDFEKYRMFEAEDKDDVYEQPVGEGRLGEASTHKINFKRIEGNIVEVMYEDVTAGNVAQGLTFMAATATIGTKSFTLNSSALNSDDILG